MEDTGTHRQADPEKVNDSRIRNYLFEFVLIFLAVFLGFLADSLREENSEKEQAMDLARSFYDELRNDSIAIRSKWDGRLKKEKAIEYLVSFLRDSNLYSTSKSLAINFIWATTARTPVIFTPRTVVLEQLKNSGGLRYFHNQRLEDLVGDLSTEIRYIEDRQALEAQVYKDHIEPIMVRHMDYEFQYRLFVSGIFNRLAEYERSDEYIPFRLSQIDKIERQPYINALSYYHTNNIRSTRMIPIENYIKVNADLLQELRNEFREME